MTLLDLSAPFLFRGRRRYYGSVNQLVDGCVCTESLPPSRGQTWVLQGLTQ